MDGVYGVYGGSRVGYIPWYLDYCEDGPLKLSKDILRKTVFLEVNPAAIAGFRRRALGTENEILAQILGEAYELDGASHIRIDSLYYPELAKSTPTDVA